MFSNKPRRCREAIRVRRRPRSAGATTKSFAMAMYVVKRDGRQEPVHFDKITARINKLAYGLNQEFCDPVGRSPLKS